MRLAPWLAVCLASCGAASGSIGSSEPEPVAPARTLAVGETHAVFDDDDPTTEDGAHVHAWRIALDPSMRVRIHVHSDDVDPMIEVRGPGLHVQNDDAFPAATLDALADFVPPEAGVYEVRTTTASPGELGAYTIRVATRSLGGVGARLGEEPLTSMLGENAQPGLPGSWLHFEGQAGSIVRLRVTSSELDPIATLIGPSGQTWVNDDANDLGADGSERALDSTIVAALPESGVYQLVVTSYGRSLGTFTVRSAIRPPVVVGDDGSRPDGLAGPNGGGRVLGLYTGITEYRDQGRLYGCADDARLLAEAMRASRLQDEGDQLVLPDGLSTRDAFLGGLAQIASQARPDDVVLIFFSGHGQQAPDRDTGDELDGLDETLVLYDGSLTDDEVVRAIDAIGAGTVILAIDACHSGGFAEDFVTRPGRMGFFSSDEDVLSSTAEARRAGGYLSWHLRRGVLGEADSRPRDGALSAGELTDYVVDGFITDHRRMNPEPALDRLQRLVVRRGAVRWDELLWVYPRNPDITLPAIPELTLESEPPG